MLKRISDVVKNEVVKKTEYNELVKKVNNINAADTNDLVTKLTITQKLMTLKSKYMIMIMINIILIKNLSSERQKILLQD